MAYVHFSFSILQYVGKIYKIQMIEEKVINIMKRKISTILFLVMALFLGLGNKAVMAEVNVPEVTFVGVDHSPLVVGDHESFYITSKNASMVQYRIFMNKTGSEDLQELTNGYTAAVDARVPYEVKYSNAFELGGYKLYIWVKKAGTDGINTNEKGSYDSIYTANLNCVEKDDNNRVYADDDMDIAKDTYTLGEKVVISGIKNIRGMQAPYKYKIHLFQPEKANDTNSGWTNSTQSYTDKIEWTPAEPGIYVIDMWATSSDSTAPYESWKLKTIKVVNSDKSSEDTNTNTTNNIVSDKVVLNTAGQTYGGSSDSDVKTVNQDVYVQENNITLQNLKVNGNVYLDPGANGVVNMNNVSATSIKVLSGAEDSVHINNVTTPILNVDSTSKVRIEALGNTKVDTTIVTSNATLDNKTGSFGIVKVQKSTKDDLAVLFKGTFKEDIIVETTATINADASAVISKINAAPSSAKDKIALNGAFKAVDITKEGKVEFGANSNVRDILKISAPADVKLLSAAKAGKVEVTGVQAGASVKVSADDLTLIDVKSDVKLSLIDSTKANVVVETANASIEAAKNTAITLDAKNYVVNKTGEGSGNISAKDLSSVIDSVQKTLDNNAKIDRGEATTSTVSGGTVGGGGGGGTTTTTSKQQVSISTVTAVLDTGDVAGSKLSESNGTVNLSTLPSTAKVTGIKVGAPAGSTLKIDSISTGGVTAPTTAYKTITNLDNVTLKSITGFDSATLEILRKAGGSSVTVNGTLSCDGYDSRNVSLTINLK